ncbi:MAG: cytochrome B [Rhodospirillaceae bacterium]|jgi:cytochrome b|nr:cytochrome B [Rhodospirillaceae bacterium]MBT5243722.1 cytochrome B [Rhodospirillaceae bacterium]MBT5563819.1 cytochrome B [Rhodospirillaceae bacterium]MBT6241692.1 cytochrome B [Rhodospirillaceae bacterium]MBT7138182.1 cytochrome B [Rhodospirillaceae bacterium]
MDKSTAVEVSPDNISERKSVRIWDLPTRVFHWVLLVLVAVAWISSEADGALFNIHIVSGIIILAMIVFRIIWGVIGSRHALFTDFVKGWSKVRAYAKNLFMFKAPFHAGHNPVGGWMIIALLVSLAVTSFSGLFISDDGYSGPLVYTVSPWLSNAMGDLHEGVAGLLGFLIGFHVLGVIGHGLMSGENLPRSMWNGNKSVPAGRNISSIASVGWWRVALAVSLSIAAIWQLLP